MPVVSGCPQDTHCTGARRCAASCAAIGSIPTSGYSNTCGAVADTAARQASDGSPRKNRSHQVAARSVSASAVRPVWKPMISKRRRSSRRSQPSRNSLKTVWSQKNPLTMPIRMRSPAAGRAASGGGGCPPEAGTPGCRSATVARGRSRPGRAGRTAARRRWRRPPNAPSRATAPPRRGFPVLRRTIPAASISPPRCDTGWAVRPCSARSGRRRAADRRPGRPRDWQPRRRFAPAGAAGSRDCSVRRRSRRRARSRDDSRPPPPACGPARRALCPGWCNSHGRAGPAAAASVNRAARRRPSAPWVISQRPKFACAFARFGSSAIARRKHFSTSAGAPSGASTLPRLYQISAVSGARSAARR